MLVPAIRIVNVFRPTEAVDAESRHVPELIVNFADTTERTVDEAHLVCGANLRGIEPLRFQGGNGRSTMVGDSRLHVRARLDDRGHVKRVVAREPVRKAGLESEVRSEQGLGRPSVRGNRPGESPRCIVRVDETSREEFDRLLSRGGGCLKSSKTTIIHETALGPTEFRAPSVPLRKARTRPRVAQRGALEATTIHPL